MAITDKGRQLSSETMVPLLEEEKRLMKKLNRTELKTLLGLLEKTRESFADACDQV